MNPADLELARFCSMLIPATDRTYGTFKVGSALSRQDKTPTVGQHRGVLAGLGDEERKRAIDQHDDESDMMSNLSARLYELLEQRCTPGPVKTALAELLDDMPNLDPDEIDRILDVSTLDDIVDKAAEKFGEDKREHTRAFLEDQIEAMRNALSRDGLANALQDPAKLESMVTHFQKHEIVGLRALVEHNGRMSIPDTGIESLLGLPVPLRGLSYTFHEEGRFTFIMPDEVLPAARQVDWDGALSHLAKRDELVRYFETYVELRGIIPYPEAIDDYHLAYPNGFATAQEINDELMDAMDRNEANTCMLDDGDEVYLLHYELLWQHRDERGLDPYNSETLLEEAPLGEMLEGLLRLQEGKAPRLPTSEMLDGIDLFYWKEKQPAARAMRDYLDAHVPDSCDDYYFADKVMEDLIEETKWGITQGSVERFFAILEDNGLVPEATQRDELVRLWANFFNNMPCWTNNGWSPVELAADGLDEPIFFDADGSVVKVGRNDPCPCGSGKKFKKCHGR